MAKSAFLNEQVVEIEIGNLKGSVTVPVILTAEQFSEYLRKSRETAKLLDEQRKHDEEERELPSAWEARFNIIRHLVIRIDFPDTDIQQFVSGTPLPFPALVWAVDTALEKTIQNALNPKNL